MVLELLFQSVTGKRPGNASFLCRIMRRSDTIMFGVTVWFDTGSEHKMSRCRACIFDLDGTLMKTQESIAKAVNRTLSDFGLKEMPVVNFNFYAGDGLDKALERALRDAGDPEAEHLQEGIPICRRYFAEDPLYMVEPYPHMAETLRILKKNGIFTAVLTNKPYLQAIEVVETIFGTDTFDVIQGQEPDIPRKPDPAGAFRVMKKLDVNPEDCMYFGDTKTDMKTGHAAGLFTVGVTWGFRPRTELEEYHADRILDDPDQIPAAVLCGGEQISS